MSVNNFPEYMKNGVTSYNANAIAQDAQSQEAVSQESIFDSESQLPCAKTLDNIDTSKYEPIKLKEDKALGFLWKTGNYTYTSSSGVKITVNNISDDMQVLEDKQTGEVVVIGANGASIEGSSSNSKITVYNSTINKINTKKGDDEVSIYDSTVNEIVTGKGSDSITIYNSTVNKKINSGSGNDFLNISDSTIDSVNTSSSFLWGLLDNGEDAVVINGTNAQNIKTGKGKDKVISDNSNVNTIKTKGKQNSLSLDKTNVNNLKTNKNDTIIEDNDYTSLNIDTDSISKIKTAAVMEIDEEGSLIEINDYVQYIINQETGFSTVEEYQQYTVDSLSASLQSMEEMFEVQEGKDGVVSDGYNALKELTGLGISDDDIENILSKQKEIVEGLRASLNGQSDMSFEEAYKHYLGVDFSTEKIDNYMKLSNTYQAVMTASQYDSSYIEKFEEQTGISVETIAKEYYLSQTQAQGKDTILSELVDKYADDQNNFADKLSTAICVTGMVCMVSGAVLCITGVGAGAGAALMASGKYISLGGMFIDNAMDLTDDITDKDGLTKDEFKSFALETGIEGATFAVNRAIGAKTSSLGNYVEGKIIAQGTGDVASSVTGAIAEHTTDAALSIGADLAIAETASFIDYHTSTDEQKKYKEELISLDDFFSAERFAGEGKNQLIATLTGYASGKMSANQQKMYSDDAEALKQYMKNQGLSDAEVNKFFEDIDIELTKNQVSLTDIDDVANNNSLTQEQLEFYDIAKDYYKIQDEETIIKYATDSEYRKQIKTLSKIWHGDPDGIGEVLSEFDGENLQKAIDFCNEHKNARFLQAERLKEIMQLDEKGLARFDEIFTHSNGYKEDHEILRIITLDEPQYQKALQLLDIGISQYEVTQYLDYDLADVQTKLTLYTESGLRDFEACDLIKFAKENNLTIEQEERIPELIKAKVGNYNIREIIALDEPQYQKALNQEKLTVVTKDDKCYDGILRKGSDGKTYKDTEHAIIKSDSHIKESGYTSAQMNVTHLFEDGSIGYGELQIRGMLVNVFAEIEHIPYDIRKGKIKSYDTKYEEVYSTIKSLSDSSYAKYNNYLTAMYEYLRLSELGIETQKPEIGDGYTDKQGNPIDVSNITDEALCKKYY